MTTITGYKDRTNVHRFMFRGVVLAGLMLALGSGAAHAGAVMSSGELYNKWKSRYEANGGDTNVAVRLGGIRGISPASAAAGVATLDLISGTVSVSTEGLHEACDVWLVDNQPGPGANALPQSHDEMVHIGRIDPANPDTQASFGAGFFRGFDVDMIAVSPADTSPADKLIMAGSRPAFERRFTRERLNTGIQSFIFRRPRPNSARFDPRVRLGLVSEEVLQGADLFFRGTFQGNGRSCGTCHEPANNLVVDPAFIQRQKRVNPANPIFVADPDFPFRFLRVPGLEKPELLREFGLIVENVDGFEDPANKFTMRSVPHTLSLATSIMAPDAVDNPDVAGDGTSLTFQERTGWSGDGVFPPGLLRLFPVGAVIQHYTRDLNIREPGPRSFRLQTDDELDKMEAYLLSTGRLNDLNLAEVTLSDPRAEMGRGMFVNGACNFCHNNAGANAAIDGRNRTIDTGVERLPNPARAILQFPADGGHGGQGLADFNFDADGDGVNDSFGSGAFNIPPLVEAADTGPFFHTNGAATIEAAVATYSSDAFNNSPAGQLVAQFFGPINLTDEQNSLIGDFLRTVNAGFNLDIAAQRIDAARRIGGAFGLSQVGLINRLISLSNEELEDALRVLSEKDLSPAVQADIRDAIANNNEVLRSFSPFFRTRFSGNAEILTQRAKESLGTGLDFVMGEGNLVF